MTETLTKVFCTNCQEYIVDAITEDIKSPLNGSMFRPREDREWDYIWPFEEETKENDLQCPMCGALFHTDGLLKTDSVPISDFDPTLQIIRKIDYEIASLPHELKPEEKRQVKRKRGRPRKKK